MHATNWGLGSHDRASIIVNNDKNKGLSRVARAPKVNAKGFSSKNEAVRRTQQRFLFRQEVDQLSERA